MDTKLRQKLIDIKIRSKKLGIIAKYNNFKSQDEFLNKLAESLSSGVEIVELSGENLTDKTFLELAKKTKQLCELFNATFIVRNRADIAYLSSADGVNLEQESIDIASVKELIGEDSIIGLYRDTREGILSAVKDGADYISVGSISSTPTEPVTSTGLEYAKWVSENNLLPVLICGELSTAQCKQLKSAGLTGFMIDSLILNSVSPNTVTVNYLDIL